MAEKDNMENKTSSDRKGNPSDTGQDKPAIKESKTSEDLNKEEEIREKHLDEGGEVPSHLEKGANPNRNPDKPDIDKPAYGSSK